jgi:hypothetical protein
VAICPWLTHPSSTGRSCRLTSGLSNNSPSLVVSAVRSTAGLNVTCPSCGDIRDIAVQANHNGQVAKTPTQVAFDDAKAAMEVADRPHSLVKSLLSGSAGGIECEKVESAFKTVFANFSKADKTTGLSWSERP